MVTARKMAGVVALIALLPLGMACGHGEETRLDEHWARQQVERIGAIEPGPCQAIAPNVVASLVGSTAQRSGPTEAFVEVSCRWSGPRAQIQVRYSAVPRTMQPQFTATDLVGRGRGPGYRWVLRPVPGSLDRRAGCTFFAQGEQVGLYVELGADRRHPDACRRVRRVGIDAGSSVFR